MNICTLNNDTKKQWDKKSKMTVLRHPIERSTKRPRLYPDRVLCDPASRLDDVDDDDDDDDGCQFATRPIYRERKCADTTGTVLVPWAAAISNAKAYIFKKIKYTEAILSNSTRKPLWLEITKMLIAL